MVTGFSNNVHKAFNSRSEALEFMRLYEIARRLEVTRGVGSDHR
jgi:hypothetical protein